MPSRSLPILYQDNHLLAVNKPAGLPTQGARPGEPSVVSWAKQYIKSRYHKPGNAYVGVVSRLDAGTTGVVVLARTSKAASRLTAQFAAGEVAKTYWAMVERQPQPPAGEFVDWLLHDDARQRVLSVPESTPGGKLAKLKYHTVRHANAGWLLELHPATGRKHQIRVQLATRSLPILGDRKYGSSRSWPRGIALHARQLQLTHPVRGEPLVVTAPVPAEWRNVGVTE